MLPPYIWILYKSNITYFATTTILSVAYNKKDAFDAPFNNMRVGGSLTLDDFVVNKLLLHLLTARVKSEVLTVKLEFHILHGASGAVLFDGKNNPVTELLGCIRIKGHMIFGKDVVLVVHDDGDIRFVVQSAASA